MSTETASALPRRDVVGFEHGFQQPLVRPVLRYAVHRDAGGQGGRDRARQKDHGHVLSRAALSLDRGECERDVAAFEDVERAGHQKTSTRRAALTSSAICSCVTRTIGWPSAFHSPSAGTAAASTWNGTPSRLRLARNFATSS